MARTLVAGIILLLSISIAAAKSHPLSLAYEVRTFARNGEAKMLVACRTLESIEFVLMTLLRNIETHTAIRLANENFEQSLCVFLHDPLYTIVHHEKSVKPVQGFEVHFYLAKIERGERYYMWTAHRDNPEPEINSSEDKPSQ